MSTIDYEAIRKAYQRKKRAEKFRSLVYTAKEGKNIIRILPPKPGEYPWYEGGVHWSVDRKNCRRLFLGEDCPICEKAQMLLRSDNDGDREYGKTLSASSVFFFPVIFRSMPDQGPKLLRVPSSVWEAIISHMADEDEPLDLPSPTNGYDVRITRTGSGIDTRYDVKVSRKSTPLGSKEQVSEWLEQRPNWTEWCEQFIDSYEDLAALVTLPDELVDNEFDDGEEKPKAKKAAPKKQAPKPKPKKVEVEEDFDDQFGDEEEEEEEEDELGDDDIPFDTGSTSEAEDAAPFEAAFGGEDDEDGEEDYIVDEETGKILPRTRKGVAKEHQKRVSKNPSESPEDMLARVRENMRKKKS